MKVGLLLALGDSFESMAKTGQDVQFKKVYLKKYSEHFEKIMIFSYGTAVPADLPKNVEVLPNSRNVHRYIYAFLLPFIYKNKIREVSVLRAYHQSGTIPAILIQILYGKDFIFNHAFNYKKFALIEHKYLQYLLFHIVDPLAFIKARKIFIANNKYTNKSKKTIFLPNGVNTEIFQLKKNFTITKPAQIITVGRLEPQKNHLMLIRALVGLKIELTIIGNGKLKSRLEKEAQKNKVKLNIINSLNYDKLPRKLQTADIFVLSSTLEGHPKALLDAMACGLPVVGTNVEGTKEIIKHNKNGLLCDLNPASMKYEIIKLIKSAKLRKQLGLAARKTVEQKYSLAKLLITEVKAVAEIV